MVLKFAFPSNCLFSAVSDQLGLGLAQPTAVQHPNEGLGEQIANLLTGATFGGTNDSTSFFVILPSGPVPRKVKEKHQLMSVMSNRAKVLKVAAPTERRNLTNLW